uniref:Glycosyltransferase family 92 protein n=1 Tax=Panagrolaimus davidi TaxID=227884 RepID=A0A914QK16_9BILA
MHTFIAVCKTVPNPTQFYLSTINSKEMAKIPIRNAIQEKLGIVSCLNPMFFAEKWQIIALSIEWYSYFGVNRQIYYFISALKGIYDMLKVYEKEKLIQIEYFTVPDIKDTDSRLQLDYHDQAGAFNDCYLNYREAADFIIVHDSDDLIYLNGNKFYQFFIQTWISQPQTAYIHFISQFAEVYSNKTLKNFDINFTMKTLNFLPITDRGKSIYNTSLIETVWSHHATVYDKKLKPKIIQDSEGMQIHARYFYDINETLIDNVTLISSLLPTDIIAINENFLQRKQLLSSYQSIKTMESTNRYYTAIDKCVQSIGGDNAEIYGCRTHYACKIPRFYNVHCIEARQTYQKYQITDSLNIFVPKSPSKPVINLNGCSL